LLIRQVADAQAAAEHDLLGNQAVGIAYRADKSAHGVGRRFMGFGVEELRADVGVETTQADVGLGQDRDDAPGRGAVPDVHAELRVVLAGADLAVRVRIDARRQAEEHVHRPGAARRQAGELRDFLQAIDDDAADTALEGQLQLGVRLVVPVHGDPFGRKAGLEGGVQLAAGGDIQVHPLLVHDADQRERHERLAGIGDGGVRVMALKGLPERLAALPDGGFIQHIQGRAVFSG